jgi:DNA-directed RNA polymerase I, II, and III subunit RPABC1
MTTIVEYKIYNNVLTYLEIIGFDYKQYEEKKKTNNDIVKILQYDDYIKLKAKNDNTGEIAYIFIVKNKSIVSKTAEFKKIIRFIKDDKFRLIIISKDGIKSTVMSSIDKMDKKIDLYDLKYVLFKSDIRKNVMVPKHELCTDEEKKRILANNFISNDRELPFIKSTDAQVIWLGGKVGQLVKIKRRDVTGSVMYYRIICK